MIRNPKILAIIPARGGSKGLPDKNIKPINGKPLIYWTINQAQKSTLISNLIVNTDSEKIANISEESGASVPFLRPKNLAEDDSSTFDVIKHTLDWYERRDEQYDIVVLLEPTSPLRKNKDIDQAIERFISHGDADSLVSLGEVQLESPYITKFLDDDYVRPVIKLDSSFHQRQQLPIAYFPYGIIYLSKVSSLLETGTFYQENTISYMVERWQNYEIDDIYDFMVIERIMKHREEFKN